MRCNFRCWGTRSAREATGSGLTSPCGNAYIETFERLEAEAGTLAPLKKILRAQPNLISRSTGQLLVSMDPVVEILAERMLCDPDTDIRPMIMVATSLVTAMAVIRLWAAGQDDELMSSLFARFSTYSDLTMLAQGAPVA